MNKSNKKQLIWNLVNCLIAGALVFLGSFSTGEITDATIIVASITAATVFVIQFQAFWNSEKDDYCGAKVFNFLPLI